ncbi:MAG: M28 family peptidase [Gemmatales bacterium]|nr:M28 family peptidase [Gemmatales bacterium]MDW7994594.1 M28 family peptidase [Gemmatales bacterium]
MRIRLAVLGLLLLAVAALSVWLSTSGTSNSPITKPDAASEMTNPVADYMAQRIVEATLTMPGRLFQGPRALQYLRDICALGPRISGSPGMKKQQELLRKHFERYGATVELQRFRAQQRSRKEPVEMVNLIARWHPDRSRRIILCTHYDTRPIADQEPDERLWTKPFLGANDGGSGVALMMELAPIMPRLPLQVGVDFVCFDGEEYIFDPRPSELGGDRYFFGSEYFAQHYAKQRQQMRSTPIYIEAVLVDMIAGKNARFYIEQYSFVQAGPLVEKIWDFARLLDCPAFIRQVKHAVLDDHLELLKVGIPAVDIIDFDYPHWHRLSDTPENCAAEGLEQVARVVLLWMLRAR